MKHVIILFITGFTLTACTPKLSAASPSEPASVTPTLADASTVVATSIPLENPYKPQPGDDKLIQGKVLITLANLIFIESLPVQVALIVSGNLPTPCHNLRAEINPPDNENKITIDLYSVADPNRICAQVLQAFDANIPLEIYRPGHYSVWVNGERVGEFDS